MELIVSQLSKAYAAVPVLREISLSARSGVLALLGPNGSGKSTLLRLLATASRADSGEITFAGCPYAGDIRRLRRMIGYLPQQLQFPEHLTPQAFLAYIAQLKGAAPGAEGPHLLEALELATFAHRPLGQLSGGQRRRVGIAQALLGSPRLLLLDEPTAGLDPEERDRVLRLITSPAPGRVVILSSHVPAEVEAVASNVIVLRRGRAVYTGEGEVEGLRSLCDGRVHEVAVAPAAAGPFMQQHLVSRVFHRGTQVVLRLLGNPPPGVVAIEAEGSLEDAYLLLQRGTA